MKTEKGNETVGLNLDTKALENLHYIVSSGGPLYNILKTLSRI